MGKHNGFDWERSVWVSVRALSIVVAVVALISIFSSSASAATEPFGKFCLTGSSDGQCELARGVAVSPVDGHIYVVDLFNGRINEFTAWGEFVRAWGWGVDTGAAGLQTCTTESGCQAGLRGTGVGQFENAIGIAVDSAGNIYVTDPSASRVQKFSPDGEFLLMFGGDVNQGPNNPGNVCTAAQIAGGDTCGAGTPGTGDGEFSPSWPFTSNLAIGPGDEVYVGDKGRIQEFNTAGVFQRMLPDPDQVLRTSDLEVAAGKPVGSLAVDPISGDIYLAYPNGRGALEPTHPEVFRLDADNGDLLDTLEVEKPTALGVGGSSNLYVFDQLRFSGISTDPLNHSTRILKFDSAGNLIEKIAETEVFGAEELEGSVGLATGSFCFGPGEEGLYAAIRNQVNLPSDFVQAFGPTPDPAKCPPPDVAPDLNGEFAASVDTDSADVRAQINPHYFTATVGTTTYRVQWGTAACIDDEGFEGTCATEQPLPPAILDSPPVDANVLTDPIILEGLEENTTYAYRFVVERERKEGSDPAVWVVKGPGAQFTTFSDKPIPPCPNDAFRTGAGAQLRDCRAYELVTPLEKGGGDVEARLNIVPFEARVDQASLSGNEITFSAYRAFEDPKSAPFSSQYLTERTAAGWDTEAISAPQEGEAFVNPLIVIDNLYRAFSPDLKQAWAMTDTEPVLGEGGLAGHPNLYRRSNDTGIYEACTTALPKLDEKGTQAPQLQGFSANGELAVFRIENKLTDDASGKLRPDNRPIYQLYACSFAGPGPATVRLVSALPDGSPSELENTAGGPANERFQFTQGRTESLENAVSADGTKVFWTASPEPDSLTPGALYVRHNPGAPPTASGACEESEPANACTIEISAGPRARFWTAADDGSVAIFTEEEVAIPGKGDLFEYIVATNETLPIAEDVLGILGSSEDATRIYFLSEDEIGGEGEAGEPNLYLYDKGAETTTYLATLSEDDASQGDIAPSPGNYEPAWHTARVTPDGSAVAFMSNSAELAEQVAGYDNTDQGSGLPAAEIYRYAIGGELACVSCNRTGARPQGRQIQNKFLDDTILYAASMLPPWLNALYAPRVLSDDGTRIFFESFESLSLADTNDKTDVYQWEAEGKGTCTEDDSAYVPQSDGCVSLLTSGKATTDAHFVDASPSGDDVFIRTPSSLVAWDPDAIDIYDARVEGGFSSPVPPEKPECKPEDCPGAVTPAPTAPAPATGGPSSGNVVPKPTKPGKRCRKGTHKVRRKGRTVCVRNKKGSKAPKSGRRVGS